MHSHRSTFSRLPLLYGRRSGPKDAPKFLLGNPEGSSDFSNAIRRKLFHIPLGYSSCSYSQGSGRKKGHLPIRTHGD